MAQFLIADDHPLFREALTGALQLNFSDLTIEEADSLESTIQQIEQHPDLDLVLLDLHMPGSGDLYGIIRIREDFPDLPVAVISGSEDIDVISKVMGYGAMGFIPKSTRSQDIATAINTILEGDNWLPDGMADKLNQLSNEDIDLANRVAELTPAQYKVLVLLHEGLLNKQIAFELNVTEATIKAHITAIFRKLGINSRTQAVLLAEKLQLDSNN